MEEISGSVNQGISRRDYLRFFLVGGASLVASSSFLGERLAIPLKKERHLVEIPGGRKIGVITGAHGSAAHPESVTPIKESDLFWPVGAYFAESDFDYFDEGQLGIIPGYLEAGLSSGDFEFEPIQFANRNSLPIILGDLPGRISNEAVKNILWASDSKAPVFSILAKMSTAAESGIMKTSLSRRNFFRKAVRGGLKIIGGTSAVLSFHFSTDRLLRIAEKLGYEPATTAARDFAAVFSDAIHPGTIMVTPRNIVWALKCLDLYNSGVIPPDKIINVGGGFAHRHFDFFARHPDFAVKYWNFFHFGDLARKLAGGKDDWVHYSFIYKHPGRQRYVEHKTLDSLR